MVPKVAALARSWTQYGAKSDQDDAVWREIAPKLRSYRDFEAIVAPSGSRALAMLGAVWLWQSRTCEIRNGSRPTRVLAASEISGTQWKSAQLSANQVKLELGRTEKLQIVSSICGRLCVRGKPPSKPQEKKRASRA